MSFEYSLINEMSQWDLHINVLNLQPGKYHRFRSLGTCKTQCCEYRIFEHQLGAHFKCFRRGIDRFWFANERSQVSFSDRMLMQQERDLATRERGLAQIKRSKKCSKFYHKASSKHPNPPINHPYVRRKGIYPHESIQVRSMIVLPIRDIRGDILSLQIIQTNGFKRFKTGAPTAEGMIWLGGYRESHYDGVVRLCEGWSTGCTLYSATRNPVVCALNAYNLIKVARLFRTHYTRAQIKICADNDQWGKNNVGIQCGEQASHENGYALYYPDFSGMAVDDKPTDFNDLYRIAGKQILKQQLMIKKGIL